MATDQHDVTRRETLAAIGMTGMIALAPAAAIANARPGRSASNAAYVRSLEEIPSLSDYGILGEGNDQSIIEAALADAQRNNATSLRIPPGTYTVTRTITVNVDDLKIYAHGATISSAMTANSPLIKVDGTSVLIQGLRTELTAPTTTAHHYRVNGDNCHVHLCDMDYTTRNVNTPALYVRDADGFKMTNCRKWGSNAFIGFFEGSNALIAYNEVYGIGSGGDDFVAIKSINRPSENIRIIGNYVEDHSALVSVGSQVGVAGVDDPTYSRYVRGVHVIGNIGKGCAFLAYIKPGSLSTADYRNGLVEECTISDNSLIDPTGEAFQAGVRLFAGRGAVIRNIKGGNNIVIARANGDSSTGIKAGALLVHGYTGGGSSTIEDVNVGIDYDDPYEGAAFGAPGTSGYPVQNIIHIDPASLTLDSIKVRTKGNGSAESGVIVKTGGDGAVTVENLTITNANVAATPLGGGVRTGSLVKIANENNVSISTAHGSKYVFDTGGSITG